MKETKFSCNESWQPCVDHATTTRVNQMAQEKKGDWGVGPKSINRRSRITRKFSILKRNFDSHKMAVHVGSNGSGNSAKAKVEGIEDDVEAHWSS